MTYLKTSREPCSIKLSGEMLKNFEIIQRRNSTPHFHSSRPIPCNSLRKTDPLGVSYKRMNFHDIKAHSLKLWVLIFLGTHYLQVYGESHIDPFQGTGWQGGKEHSSGFINLPRGAWAGAISQNNMGLLKTHRIWHMLIVFSPSHMVVAQCNSKKMEDT